LVGLIRAIGGLVLRTRFPRTPYILQILEKFDILRKIQKKCERAMSKASNNH